LSCLLSCYLSIFPSLGSSLFSYIADIYIYIFHDDFACVRPTRFLLFTHAYMAGGEPQPSEAIISSTRQNGCVACFIIFTDVALAISHSQVPWVDTRTFKHFIKKPRLCPLFMYIFTYIYFIYGRENEWRQ